MSHEHSLSDVLLRTHQNQLALEAALIELTLKAEKQGLPEFGKNVPGVLDTAGGNTGHIWQALERLRSRGL